MKNREIEKQLKNELSVASNSDFSALMKKCEEGDGIVLKRERVVAYADGGTSARTDTSFKPIFAIGILFLLIVALLIILPLGFDSGSSSGYFVIDINPSLKISYDKNGTVTDVTALNEDAEVLLVGLDFSGKTSEEAVSMLFEKCVALGYFSAERDNNAVLASATTDTGEQDEEKTKQIKELFTREFSSKKMRGVVITATNDPSLSQKANEHGIDTQKYALIESYLELGGALDESQYSEISISELYSKISDKEKELKSQRLDNTIREKEKAQNELFDALANRVSALLNKLEACIRELENEPSEQRGEKQAPPSSEPHPHAGLKQEMVPPNNAQENQGKERYEGFSKSLGDYVVELEIAKESSDCARAVDGILSILSNMKEDEENASLVELIDSTISEIQTLYEEFSKNAEELSALKASAEETNSARLDAFKDMPQGEHENVDDWQKEKEDEIASSWYELKKQWNNERKNDLKK